MFRMFIRDCARWWRDPLSHPDIARMSERERADLPFDRPFDRPVQARP